jgi:hypothetical protein
MMRRIRRKRQTIRICENLFIHPVYVHRNSAAIVIVLYSYAN